MSARVLRGDARALPLSDASVDLIVTSPPYWALRSYTDTPELCARCRELTGQGWEYPRVGDEARDLRQAWPDWDAHVKAEHKAAHYAGQIGAEPTPAAYIDSLIDCTREWMRVLKPTGSMWVNLGDKYSGAQGQTTGATSQRHSTPDMWARTNPKNIGIPAKSLIGLPWRYALCCIDDLGLILRAEVIWSKPNALPESVSDRVRRSHEQWFHMVKSPRYFAAVDTIREAHAERYAERVARYGGRDRDSLPSRQYATGDRNDSGDAKGILGLNRTGSLDPLGKIPGSVWEIATQPLKVPAGLGVDHFAAFPMEWPRRIISGWSPEGGIVVDPFGGTGTTALVAEALGRRGVSIDMSADYCRLARWRVADPGQRAAALEVPKPDPQHAGQLDLFDLAGVR